MILVAVCNTAVPMLEHCRYHSLTVSHCSSSVVKMTTSSAVNDENFSKMTKFPFQWHCIYWSHSLSVINAMLAGALETQVHQTQNMTWAHSSKIHRLEDAHFRSGFRRRDISSVYLWCWWQGTKIERLNSMRKLWLKAQNNLNNEISKAMQLTLYTHVFCHYWWNISRSIPQIVKYYQIRRFCIAE